MRGNKKSRRKKRARLNFFCTVAVISSIMLTGAAFNNMMIVDYKEDRPQEISKVPSKHQQQPQELTPKKPFTIQSKNTNITDINNQPSNVDDKNFWELILVNPWNKLSDNFAVELIELKNGHSVDERIYNDLQKMMDDARAEGLSPIICSSYRTNQKQQTLFDNQVAKLIKSGYSQSRAEKEASTWVALPETSEHQTGLAVDIVALSYQTLDDRQANTAEQKWLMENSYKYGFVLRYPIDKTDITGISYEPWHYRYVGKEVAKEIYNKGICLEEYLTSHTFTQYR